MIYDAENNFFYKQDLSSGTSSNVVWNGGGSAYVPLWLSITVDSALAADATVTIQTSDKEDMSGAETLLTVPVPKEAGTRLAVRMPNGGKTYYQINVSMTLGEGASASGTLTAALVLDTEME